MSNKRDHKLIIGTNFQKKINKSKSFFVIQHKIKHL